MSHDHFSPFYGFRKLVNTLVDQNYQVSLVEFENHGKPGMTSNWKTGLYSRSNEFLDHSIQTVPHTRNHTFNGLHHFMLLRFVVE